MELLHIIYDNGLIETLHIFNSITATDCNSTDIDKLFYKLFAEEMALKGDLHYSLYFTGRYGQLDFSFDVAQPNDIDYIRHQLTYDPFQAAFDRIPKGYKRILEYLGANGFKENHGTTFLGCFEEVYEKDGVTCMDIFIHADCVSKANIHSDFSRDV